MSMDQKQIDTIVKAMLAGVDHHIELAHMA